MKNILLLLLVSSLLVVSGCKQQKIVDGVEVSTEQVGADKIIRGDFDFAFNDFEFPSGFWQIPNNAGTLEIAHIAGQNRVIVDLNITALLKLPSGEAKLPNGTPIPASIRGEGGIVQVNIPDINARVYVSYKGGETMIGFAISMKGLDDLNYSSGNSNIFLNFSGNNLRGIAGLFSGAAPGETGITSFIVFKDGSESSGYIGEHIRLKMFKELNNKQAKRLERSFQVLKNKNPNGYVRLN